jgi:hypothetical protein
MGNKLVSANSPTNDPNIADPLIPVIDPYTSLRGTGLVRNQHTTAPSVNPIVICRLTILASSFTRRGAPSALQQA